ncbi:MAG: YidC/Oxa1 family membrane protein insertase [Clostridiales bacterium]|nr:YidC/Oxa1 family membrane protein insertase [Clostridiales bacterium]
MSFAQLLYQLLISPLELIFETIYSFAYGIIGNAGLSILPLSLLINLLLLPFYNRADLIQKEQHDIEAKLAPGIAHLKKTFKGDKRFMILQTYYRQNHYSPLSALRSSFAVLLEIPFFIAVYHFLSHFETLNGASLGPLKDLGSPDGLLTVASLSINLLPILMTLINILSSKIYAKDLSTKDKLRMYAISLVFLVLLYRSPSGLVFYWTLNQVFSLIKNIVKASENPKSILRLLLIAMSAFMLVYTLLIFDGSRKNFLILLVFSLIPIIVSCSLHFRIGKSKVPHKEAPSSEPLSGRIFFFSSLFLAVLTGLLIPSSVVSSSPSEFVIFTSYRSPVNYVILSFSLSLGIFVIWCGLFYYLSSLRARRVFSIVMCSIAICSILNYYLSGRHLTYLDTGLSVAGGLVLPNLEMLLDLLFLPLLVGLIVLLWKKRASILPFALLILCCGTSFLGIYNIVKISKAMPPVKRILEKESGRKASFTLSRDGKNVVVLMLDRAISCYIPYLFNEDPSLEAQFDGFTWYPNCLAFGGSTNIATPALFGGYEYQPMNLNARSDLTIGQKHNEAIRVMPVLFDEAGYDVTVCDPPYAGYSSPPDLSIYDDHPDIDAYLTQYGQYWDPIQNHERQEHIWTRNFFCYAFTRIMPLPAQEALYDSGRYHDPNWNTDSVYQTQYLFGPSEASGYSAEFMYAYSFLQALRDTTDISSGSENTFLMVDNCTTHNVAMLKEPEYIPAMDIDNREYDAAHQDRFTTDGKTIAMSTDYQYAHYQSNMAALREVGKWLDYLREEGVYDNTRIIIVSDHGYYLEHMEEMVLGHDYMDLVAVSCEDMLAYNALLMVKDFGSTGFSTDYTFMTNADTPVLAFADLIEDPVNPATGNPITSDAKYEDKLHVMYSPDWTITTNNGNTFSKGIWFSLKNQNIFDPENWEDEGIH